MPEKEFNLLDEPWILVMRPDGETEEVSLLEAFRRAPEWKGLAGELPAQDIAVLRLLLAILHAVFGRYDPEGNFVPLCAGADPLPTPADALKRWKALWDLGRFPMGILEKYLNRYRDRFWLFHPERPFYQVPGLLDREDKFGPFEASKLNGELAESDHKTRLFPQRAGSGKNVLRYSEAARWLLYVNAFSETFGKLEAKGKRQKNSPSLGVGWLGKLGLIAAVGDSLFETLMLNLVFLRDGGNELWGEEKPVWETEAVRTDERNEIAVPDNPSELLTLQSRRLLLKRENGAVVGYVLLSGDFFPKENAFAEQMTVWRNTAKKETDPPEYVPRRHDPSRQIWRDFPTLVAQSTGSHRPGIVSWLALLKAEELIPQTLFRFQTAGVSYGTMEAVIEDVFDDSISFNADLLTALGADWINRIIDEVDTSEKLVEHIGWLAQNLAKAEGDADGHAQRNAAREQAYFRLDAPFRRWLEAIDPNRDRMDDVSERWWTQAKRITRNLGKELVGQCGPQAFIGRSEITKSGEEIRHTAPQAYNLFLYATSSRDALKGGRKNDRQGKTGRRVRQA